MNIYKSKSSVFVRIATLGCIIIMSIVILGLILSNKNYGLISAIVLSIVIVGTLIYFFSNSLNSINIEEEAIVLKKNKGQIRIPISEIQEIQELEFSNLTMTFGSKGVFGFIGKTMDGSISMVKDRKNMIKIVTLSKNYLVSSEKSHEFVRKLKELIR